MRGATQWWYTWSDPQVLQRYERGIGIFSLSVSFDEKKCKLQMYSLLTLVAVAAYATGQALEYAWEDMEREGTAFNVGAADQNTLTFERISFSSIFSSLRSILF